MSYSSLGEFLDYLSTIDECKTSSIPISRDLELTEIHSRLIQNSGPAYILSNIYDGEKKFEIPAIINLFGTVDRVALGLGTTKDGLQELGRTLAYLKQPQPPKGIKDVISKLPLLKKISSTRPKFVKSAAVQELVFKGDDIDLEMLPIQKCWPGEPAPLITWPLVVTRPVDNDAISSYNVGIYRMQVASHKSTIMRWLEHRGGAQHFYGWKKAGKKMPVSVVIGADPATILASVIPLPDNMSEYYFSGIFRETRLELVKCKTNDLYVPANAEIVLEGFIDPSKPLLNEGPYGDHTGYYNDIEQFPEFEITAITMRKKPLYLTTYTGRPPDEPAILGAALNELVIPLLQNHFPEIQDFWLPPEGCSYRVAVVSIKKIYPGQARRIMMGIWSFLRQFVYTKFVIVVDDDINVRSWDDVIWAISTRSDPARDLVVIENTPIDYLDFASPVSGLGGKLGIDATNKIFPETNRNWGEVLKMDEKTKAQVDKIWDTLTK